ncbi:type II secretion system F family protein [Spirulina sp. CCNP1310]|uniref:type II secretion system F family protein n=1 Tax=Spirulina sp. CCNP1310 TaxID=3110249 RepID=UPI002B200D73|nr:type II secretion system F family protein [Spirulina sp. CCNP1310]MEA5420276.1 type II secretion system F family protein [Spirulina sp. CCNP1310]
MPKFIAEVRDSKGNIVKETIAATSAEQARLMLQNQYPTIGKVERAAGLPSLDELTEMMTAVSVKDKAVFSRQFAVMINAGVAMVRSLGILQDQCPNPKLKKALTGISTDVQAGIALSEAMRKYPECFDQLYVAMVDAGETGGVLDQVLDRLAVLLENMQRLTNQIKSAMTYPMAVGSLAVIVFFAMTIFLIPIFAGIFQDLGTTLPLLTQIMLFLSDLFIPIKDGKLDDDFLFWPLLLGSVFGLMTGYKMYYKTPMGHLQIDAFFLKAPLVGDLNTKSAVARFCRIFGTLTRSGVPILNCMDIVRDVAGNQVVANAIERAKSEIQQGGMISVALEQEKVFPPLAIQMISIGEETGELDAMMMKVADFYEDEVEQAVKALTSVIEPLMMVGVAALVGVILLSMYLPMFAVFDQLG